MRITLALATLSIGATSAAAQAFPPGSYQGSCTQVHWAGTTLVAECRRHDSRTTGTGLPNASRCTGDIANNDGQLICSHGASPPPAATPEPPRGPAPSPPGYGAPPGPGPVPGNPPPPGYGTNDEHRARCEELWHREQDLRDRLQSAPWGPEREHIEDRVHETHEDRERLGCER